MAVKVAPFNSRQVPFDIKTGGWTVEGLRQFQDMWNRMGGAIAPSNNELQGFADAAQAAADAAQASANTAQSTANTAASTAVAAAGAAATAQADANSAQGTADSAVLDAAAAQSTANTAVTNAATAQSGVNALNTMLAIPSGRVPYGSGTAITSEAAFSYDAATNTLTVDRVKGSLWSGIGAGVTVTDNGVATQVGFYSATPIVQPTTAGAAAAFVAGAGTAVNDASTFDGYTLRQVVRALRTYGLLA